MRFRVTSLFVAAALVVAAPAYAQRASLADRVAVLEQQQANSQANNDLLNQLQQARSDLQGLRATVDSCSTTTNNSNNSPRTSIWTWTGV